jgi:hypothetical protein
MNNNTNIIRYISIIPHSKSTYMVSGNILLKRPNNNLCSTVTAAILDFKQAWKTNFIDHPKKNHKQLEQMKTNLSWSLSSKLMFLIQIQDKWCQSWNLNKNPSLWKCYKKKLHLWFFFGWSIKFVFHACLKSKMAAVTVEHKLLLGWKITTKTNLFSFVLVVMEKKIKRCEQEMCASQNLCRYI